MEILSISEVCVIEREMKINEMPPKYKRSMEMKAPALFFTAEVSIRKRANNET